MHKEKEVMVEVNGEELYGEGVLLIEEEDEVKDMDGVQFRQTKLKTELQHMEIKMEMMEIKYRTMVDNISVPWFPWKLKMSSLKQKCPLW